MTFLRHHHGHHHHHHHMVSSRVNSITPQGLSQQQSHCLARSRAASAAAGCNTAVEAPATAHHSRCRNCHHTREAAAAELAPAAACAAIVAAVVGWNPRMCRRTAVAARSSSQGPGNWHRRHLAEACCHWRGAVCGCGVASGPAACTKRQLLRNTTLFGATDGQTTWDSTPRVVTPSCHVRQRRNTRCHCTTLPASHLLRDCAWRCHGWRPTRTWARRQLHKRERILPPDSSLKEKALDVNLTQNPKTSICIAPPEAAGHPIQQCQCPTRGGCWVPRGHHQRTHRAVHPETCVADRSVVDDCCKCTN
jgi:hypothetical protein